MPFARSRRVRAVVAASVLVSLMGASATRAADFAAGSATGFATDAQVIAVAKSQVASLAGANDWSCKPSVAHPYPVVLAHGTLSTAAALWSAVAAALKQDGYCLYALTYGTVQLPLIGSFGPGVAHIDKSAGELATFVDGVLAATHADKVDIVGQSQGGMMPRQYMRFHGGAAKVRLLFGVAPTNHGTSALGFGGIADELPFLANLVGGVCPACVEQLSDSQFIARLNAGGDTLPGVRYVVVASKLDDVATPYDQSSFLRDANPNVTNITLQDVCPSSQDKHATIAQDPVVLRLLRNALDPVHPVTPTC